MGNQKFLILCGVVLLLSGLVFQSFHSEKNTILFFRHSGGHSGGHSDSSNLPNLLTGVSARSAFQNSVVTQAGSLQHSEVEAIFQPGVSSSRLFNFLFSPAFVEWISADEEALQVVGLKFVYSSNGSPNPDPKELASRIGILRALEGFNGPNFRSLYVKILTEPTENWVVKRQALRSFLSNQNSFSSEAERNHILGQLDSRAIATANDSYDEFFERVLHHDSEEQ